MLFKKAGFGNWLFESSCKKASNLAGPLDRAVLTLGTIGTVNLLRYATENRSSPCAITVNWLLKKNKTCTNPQTKNHKKNH